MRKNLKIGLAAARCFVILLALSYPSWVRARSTGHCTTCVNHQMQIDGAKQQWRVDNHKTANDVPTWTDLVGKGRYLPEVPICPDGGTYTLGRADDVPRCSIPTHRLH